MLTKKYFEDIARIIKQETFSHPEMNKNLCGRFSNYLSSDNPQFNSQKFKEACEVSK